MVGRHAGDNHGSPTHNRVLCVDTSDHLPIYNIDRELILTQYLQLTVFIWQNFSISASGHRKSMILTYFVTISCVELVNALAQKNHIHYFPIIINMSHNI